MSFKNEYNFYKKIISWDVLLRKGYFDFQEFNNPYSYDDSYGRTDVIYPNYFNLRELFKSQKNIEKIKNFEYFNGIDVIENDLKNPKKNKSYRFTSTTPILFTIPKNENNRRPLKFANLYSYCLLARVILVNKENIVRSLMSDKESTSRYFGYAPYDFKVTKSIADKLLIGHTYYFKTDFSNFYHAFYTHAIAWIFLGKDTAKKNRRDQENFANLLDHAIRSLQDGETHGLPTGSLLIRIIVEYFMSKIDRIIRKAFCTTSITFNRYVDDFIFGYDKQEDLVKIKKVMEEVTQEYGIYLNDKKTTHITYSEIKKDSQLIGYFDRLSNQMKSVQKAKLLKNQNQTFNSLMNLLINSNRYNIKNCFDNFYNELNNEILNQTKGAGKLSFRVLMFFIKSVKNDPTAKNISSNPLYQTLHALIEKSPRVDEKVQSTFIEKMLQLALSDSKLMLPFIQLLDVIQSREKEINNKIVTYYLKGFIENMENSIGQESFLANKLYFYLSNNLHQEAYSVLLLFSKLNIELSKNMTDKIINLITNAKDLYFDDFTLLFFVHYFVMQEKNLNLSDKNAFFKMIDKLLSVESFAEECFTGKHWLLRYEILFLDKNNQLFQKDVKSYYRNTNKKVKNLSFKFFEANHNSGNDCIKHINKFYFNLLKEKISFTSF